MLKRQITKTEHAALAPALQLEYKADSVGENFTLDVSGFDDPAELRRAKEREKQRADDAETRATEAEARLNALGPDAKRKLADIDTLEKSWKNKFDTETNKLTDQLKSRDSVIQRLTVDAQAQTVANEIAGDNASILLPHIQRRLTVEYADGQTPLTRVLDKDGKASALSLDDLKKEFREDSRYKAVVIATRANGGGAAGGGQSGQGSGAAGDYKGKKFHELTTAQKVQWYKEDQAGFEQASKQADAARREAVPQQTRWVPA